MASFFDYTIATDIVAGKLNEARLRKEIEADPLITIGLLNIARTDGTFRVTFKADLPASDKTALDGDISAPAGGVIGPHSGEPLALHTRSKGVQLTATASQTIVDDTVFAADVEYQGTVVAVEGRQIGDQLIVELVHPGAPDTVLSTPVDVFVPADGDISILSDSGRPELVAADLIRCRFIASATAGTRTITVEHRIWA